MSSDLSVRIPGPVEIAALVQPTEATLHTLLNVPRVPSVHLFLMQAGNQRPVHTGRLSHDQAGMFFFQLDGFIEAVGVTVVEVPPHPLLLPEESGLWAHITVAAARTPLEFALAASVAVALARLVGSTVIDDDFRWNPVFEQSPDAFLEAVRVPEPMPDLPHAAAVMYTRIRQRTKT